MVLGNPSSAIVYLRNIATPFLLFQICALAASRQRLAVVGPLSVIAALALLYGYVELDYPLGPREQADAYMRTITEIGEKVSALRDKIEDIDKKNNRVYLAGKNLGKRHQKPDLNNHEGGIVDIPMPLHISNVALVDPKSKKATRLGFKTDGDKKVRVAKKSKQTL